MVDYKNSKIERSTITYNRDEIEKGNIYEAISIIAKRSQQINSEIVEELKEKLQQFATENEGIEEIFENREQIEISRYYESLPKPHSVAIQEWLEDKIHSRNTEEDEESIAEKD